MQAMGEAASQRKQVADLTLLRCQPAPAATDPYELVGYTRRMTAPYQNLVARLTAPHAPRCIVLRFLVRKWIIRVGTIVL